MKKPVILTTAFVASLFVFLIACQAQSTIDLDSLYNEMAADPITHEYKEYGLQIRNMIQFNYVDLESTHKVYDEAGVDSYCDIHDDVSHIRGAREYMDVKCKKYNLLVQIKEKYPNMGELTSEQRIELMQPGTGVTKAELLEIINNRRPKDTNQSVPD